VNVDRIGSRAARLPWPALFLLLLAACNTGGSGQSGSAFVFLSVAQITGNDGQGSSKSSLDDPAASTAVCVAVQNTLKNPTVTAPTVLDNVTITSYTVTYSRFDGGPPPGPFTLGTSFSVPAGTPGSAIATIVILPPSAKSSPPLNPRPRLPLGTTATIVLQGRDGRGNGVSTQGSLTVNFVAGVVSESQPVGCAAPAPSPTPTPTPTPTPLFTPTATPTVVPTVIPTVTPRP
jgi:hypothetical protein